VRVTGTLLSVLGLGAFSVHFGSQLAINLLSAGT
jgi:hypothetical protein